jgi:hypothetical protein
MAAWNMYWIFDMVELDWCLWHFILRHIEMHVEITHMKLFVCLKITNMAAVDSIKSYLEKTECR